MAKFEAIYQAYFTYVYHYALNLCGQKALAEDLTQETFLKAMDALPRFRGDSELTTWLCAITRNLYYSFVRKNSRVVLTDSVDNAADPFDPEDRVSLKSEGESAYARVLALPEPMRQVFLLRFEQGLSFQDIGSLFQKSANWACVTYHRARGKLRRELEEEHENQL